MTHVIAAAAKANFGGALERRHRAPDEYSYSPASTHLEYTHDTQYHTSMTTHISIWNSHALC
jgi:hypothetical protein